MVRTWSCCEGVADYLGPPGNPMLLAAITAERELLEKMIDEVANELKFGRVLVLILSCDNVRQCFEDTKEPKDSVNKKR